jgi:AcrR family transcriptional regulator
VFAGPDDQARRPQAAGRSAPASAEDPPSATTGALSGRSLTGVDPASTFNQVVGGVDRREQLLVAAFGRVAEVGFEGLRLRQVAEQAGIDHSTLHHHFATKQALIAALAEFTTRQFWSSAPSSAEPATALHEHLGALRCFISDRPELMVVAAELDLRARRDPAVAALLARQEHGWRTLLVDLISRGGWTSAGAAEAAAELVIATVKGVRFAPELAGPVLAQLEAAAARGGAAADPRKATMRPTGRRCAACWAPDCGTYCTSAPPSSSTGCSRTDGCRPGSPTTAPR